MLNNHLNIEERQSIAKELTEFIIEKNGFFNYSKVYLKIHLGIVVMVL